MKVRHWLVWLSLATSLVARVALLVFFASLAIQPDSWIFGVGAVWMLLLALGVARAGWVYWAGVGTDVLLIAGGALAVPEFGRLHGGELFVYLAIPAVVDLPASGVARWRRRADSL